MLFVPRARRLRWWLLVLAHLGRTWLQEHTERPGSRNRPKKVHRIGDRPNDAERTLFGPSTTAWPSIAVDAACGAIQRAAGVEATLITFNVSSVTGFAALMPGSTYPATKAWVTNGGVGDVVVTMGAPPKTSVASMITRPSPTTVWRDAR